MRTIILLLMSLILFDVGKLCAREIGALPLDKRMTEVAEKYLEQQAKERAERERALAEQEAAAEQDREKNKNDLVLRAGENTEGQEGEINQPEIGVSEQVSGVEMLEIPQAEVSEAERNYKNPKKEEVGLVVEKKEYSETPSESGLGEVAEEKENEPALQNAKPESNKVIKNEANIRSVPEQREELMTIREKRLQKKRMEIAKERAEETSPFKKKAIENTERRERKYDQIMLEKQLKASRFQKEAAEKAEKKKEEQLKKQQEKKLSPFTQKAIERAEARAKAREEKSLRLKRNREEN